MSSALPWLHSSQQDDPLQTTIGMRTDIRLATMEKGSSSVVEVHQGEHQVEHYRGVVMVKM